MRCGECGTLEGRMKRWPCVCVLGACRCALHVVCARVIASARVWCVCVVSGVRMLGVCGCALRGGRECVISSAKARGVCVVSGNRRGAENGARTGWQTRTHMPHAIAQTHRRQRGHLFDFDELSLALLHCICAGGENQHARVEGQELGKMAGDW